ncbi:hypothetical protein DM01DRAFT_1333250 [Hesseltinella vesiculosa]|uniref:Uncharacterized protein n=1 Tax=Hesseltinella vesiculosa TaxID=101127 RepID=A0A1X2GRW1_9FUNG|nr:hypothetical protein DM01DRAFT_1333250 [Hesseltinella vesiculosa]
MSRPKIASDHIKLLIAAKLIIDDFATRLPLLPSNGSIKTYCVQLCGYCAEIICLDLVDNGLYVAIPFARLTSPRSFIEFTRHSQEWFDTLFQFKIRAALSSSNSQFFS